MVVGGMVVDGVVVDGVAVGGVGTGGVVTGGAVSGPVDVTGPVGAALFVSAAVSERPHFGQAIQPAWSGARQSGQRPWVNGSITPQTGQTATPLSMNVEQNGQGCL